MCHAELTQELSGPSCAVDELLSHMKFCAALIKMKELFHGQSCCPLRADALLQLLSTPELAGSQALLALSTEPSKKLERFDV